MANSGSDMEYVWANGLLAQAINQSGSHIPKEEVVCLHVIFQIYLKILGILWGV